MLVYWIAAAVFIATLITIAFILFGLYTVHGDINSFELHLMLNTLAVGSMIALGIAGSELVAHIQISVAATQ
jgi:hypothetical protein